MAYKHTLAGQCIVLAVHAWFGAGAFLVGGCIGWWPADLEGCR